jgi:hypothetical protein
MGAPQAMQLLEEGVLRVAQYAQEMWLDAKGDSLSEDQ